MSRVPCQQASLKAAAAHPPSCCAPSRPSTEARCWPPAGQPSTPSSMKLRAPLGWPAWQQPSRHERRRPPPAAQRQAACPLGRPSCCCPLHLASCKEDCESHWRLRLLHRSVLAGRQTAASRLPPPTAAPAGLDRGAPAPLWLGSAAGSLMKTSWERQRRNAAKTGLAATVELPQRQDGVARRLRVLPAGSVKRRERDRAQKILDNTPIAGGSGVPASLWPLPFPLGPRLCNTCVTPNTPTPNGVSALRTTSRTRSACAAQL